MSFHSTLLQGTMMKHLVAKLNCIIIKFFLITLNFHFINFHGVTCKVQSDVDAMLT
jgi:hypothetical protein